MYLKSVLLACVAVLSPFAALPEASGLYDFEDSSSVNPGHCTSSLSDPKAPVILPMTEAFGKDNVATILAVFTESIPGKLVFNEEAGTCIAHMDGTVLAETLQRGLDTELCSSIYNISQVPFVSTIYDLLTEAYLDENAPSGVDGVMNTLKVLSNTSNDEVDQFCNLMVPEVVPCLSSQMLPSLAVVRAKHSDGCCAGWLHSAQNDFGYSISGQITSMMQMIGDVVCPVQSTDQGDVRCGFSIIRAMLQGGDDFKSFAGSILQMLQIPDDQMCLAAEGETYVNTEDEQIDSTDSTLSGCVVSLEKLAQYAASIPFVRRGENSDVRKLFEKDTCMKSSKLGSLFKYFFDDEVAESFGEVFGDACIHLGVDSADDCTFSRPAKPVKWQSTPHMVDMTASGVIEGSAEDTAKKAEDNSQSQQLIILDTSSSDDDSDVATSISTSIFMTIFMLSATRMAM